MSTERNVATDPTPAEEILASTALAHPGLVATAGNLPADAFKSKTLAVVWASAVRLGAGGGLEAVVADLKARGELDLVGGPAGVAAMVNGRALAEDLGPFAEIVRAAARGRKFAHVKSGAEKPRPSHGPFVKLFASILHSSVWLLDPEERLFWIALLTMADATGFVEGAVNGLAHAANLPLEACERALAKFLAPDPSSKDPENGGRRIEKVERGWRILNHGKYRGSRTLQQTPNAIRQRRYRERKKQRGER